MVEALTDAWAARPSGGNGIGAGIAFQRYETEFTYVATYAEVEVDNATGVIRVRKVLAAHDCGLVINPDGLRNQIEGNVIQGLSRTLKEEVHFDARGVTSVVWQQNEFNPTPQYSVLRFSEVPNIEIILIDRPDQHALGRRTNHRHHPGFHRKRRLRRHGSAHPQSADDPGSRARRTAGLVTRGVGGSDSVSRGRVKR